MAIIKEKTILKIYDEEIKVKPNTTEISNLDWKALLKESDLNNEYSPSLINDVNEILQTIIKGYIGKGLNLAKAKALAMIQGGMNKIEERIRIEKLKNPKFNLTTTPLEKAAFHIFSTAVMSNLSVDSQSLAKYTTLFNNVIKLNTLQDVKTLNDKSPETPLSNLFTENKDAKIYAYDSNSMINKPNNIENTYTWDITNKAEFIYKSIYNDTISEKDFGRQGLPGLDRSDRKNYLGITKDSINALEYGKKGNPDNDDLIKFIIYDVINDKYIRFRNTISGLTDSFSANYNDIQYIGRPDSFVIYTDTKRDISFTLKVMVGSRQELKVVWQKINYLNGLCYPNIINKRMIAPLIRITIGDLYDNVPAVITQLSNSFPEEAYWELDDKGKSSDVAQLPTYIEISFSLKLLFDSSPNSKSRHFTSKEKGWINE